MNMTIVCYAEYKNIDTIVIGHDSGWKPEVNMGKRNNQNFVRIHFNSLMQIRYKAEERGVNAIIQEESHTSRCSFLDGENIEHHDVYTGKRIKCGTFRTVNGILIHVDLNAIYNIIKKAIPEAFVNWIEDM